MALEASAPNWGGSLAAMRALADDAQRFADRNPKLRKLLGNADVQQGHALRLEGRYADAEALYRRALSHGDDHDWYDALARCLQAAGKWQALLQVSDEWNAALDQVGAQVWRGIALVQLGRPEEALAAYEIALRVDPENARTLELHAAALRRLGRFADAASDLRHALALHYNGWSVTQLAEIAAEAPGTAAQSAELARALVAANPTYHEAWFLLGSALRASGNPEASAAFERYVALAQSDGAESTRLAQVRRFLHPPVPGGRTLPALAYLGLAHPKP
jgi:tetratricopeptide (TPR) repeat protein